MSQFLSMLGWIAFAIISGIFLIHIGHRWAMKRSRTDGTYKTWRTWLDACAFPTIRDFRDPDL